MKNKPTIAFFGSDQFSITVLESLKEKGFIPTILITQPDKPKGRKLVLTPPDTKVWAEENKVGILQPEKLDDDFVKELKSKNCDLFIVASYGKIIPQSILDLPKFKTLNVHPSLLPLYRGATPVESAILDDSKETGVTIMLMDAKMDHGPVLDQELVVFEKWPTKLEVEDNLAKLGGDLLSNIIPEWIDGNVDEQDQDHDLATFTKKIEKSNGEIDLNGDPHENYLKTVAYNPWPGTFFFKDDKRIKITEADLIDDKFVINKVIPEGKKEIDFEDLK
jgi:methionyl-tRNA formyltransferase